MNKKTSFKHSVQLREKPLKSGNKSLYLDIYLGKAERFYEFLGIYYNPKNIADKREKLRIAEEIRLKKELEIISNDHGIIPVQNKRLNYIDYFENICKTKPKTEKAWWNTLRYLEKYSGGMLQFSAINDIWLENFKRYLLTQLAASTAHTYFSKIKASLNLAFKEKIIITNPGQLVKQIPKKDISRSYLTKEELQILSNTPCRNNNVKLAFLFACNTGLRIGDIRALTFQDVYFNEKKIAIKQKKTQDILHLPLNKMALSILQKLKDNPIQNVDYTVFSLPAQNGILSCIKDWAKKAGITKNITFHTSRHTFATIALNEGVDIYTVSKLLGHRDIKNTQIYAKIIDASMAKAVSKLDEIKVSL